MNTRRTILLGVVLGLLVLAACAREEPRSFAECVAAGNPVMESYPEQCRYPDGTVVTNERGEEEPGGMPKLRAENYALCADGRQEGLAADLGYDCVAACPDGFDSFMTQIGLETCLRHVGEEEIRLAARCASRNDCTSEQACILADRTTDGEEVAWTTEEEGFRCLLQPYFDYRLQTSGATFLDENGERGTVIA